MVINRENALEMQDKFNIHDAFIKSISTDYENQTIVVAFDYKVTFRTHAVKKKQRLTCKNGVYLESIVVGFWYGSPDIVNGHEFMTDNDKIESLRELCKQSNNTSMADELSDYITIRISSISGDTIKIVCKEAEFEEFDWPE